MRESPGAREHGARRYAALLALALAGVGPSACTTEEILLADVPVKERGMEQGGSPARCTDEDDCGPGSFCDRKCGALAGTCEPYPLSCSDDERPVCGCNGVTYFNDCLRRAAGVAALSDEECHGLSRDCDSPNEVCPKGSFCARLVGSANREKASCEEKPRGQCWVLPATCPAPTRSDRWDACGIGANEPLRCVGTCSAIRSGQMFVRAERCE